ncbi:MAG: hypothetical protein WEB06_05030 [Actinomycetota bacterium]
MKSETPGYAGRLECDLDGGRRPDHEVEELRRRHGDATVLAWEAP